VKISAEQKKECRKAILDAAVDIVIEKGLKASSMRAIARKAGVGDATIYNYFSSKEALVYGYYRDAITEAVQSLASISDFSAFNLNEKIQTLMETILENFLGDREFVDQTFASVFFTPIPSSKDIKEIRSVFVQAVEDFISLSVDSAEIPELMLRDLVYQCVWDFFIAATLYWLKDDSDQFTNTTVFLEKSIDLGYTVLVSGVLDKVTGLASFLFNSHVLSRLGLLMERKDTFERIKEEFMSHDDKG
jgi:AcrR family transcriptional regulator